jgi:hypothetical protein
LGDLREHAPDMCERPQPLDRPPSPKIILVLGLVGSIAIVPNAIRAEGAKPPVPPRVPSAERIARGTGVLMGEVRSLLDGRPLSGATLSSELPLATVRTDSLGRFRLVLVARPQRIRIEAPDHVSLDLLEAVDSGETLEVLYSLPLSPEAAARRETPSPRKSDPAGNAYVVPGTLGDPLREILLLPGVSSLLAGMAHPIVRGTQPAATGYFIDGIRVPQLFHGGFGPAVVHPDLVDTFRFHPGAPPPEYGRLVGGVVDGRTEHRQVASIQATAYSRLTDAGGFVNVPFPGEGANVTLAGRLAYASLFTDLVAGLSGPSAPKPIIEFSDYQGRVEKEAFAGTLRLFAFGSSDRVGAAGGPIHEVVFHRVDARYTYTGPRDGIEAGLTGGIDGIAIEDPSGNLETEEHRLAARGRWTRRIGDAARFSLGAEVERRTASLLVPAEATADPRPAVRRLSLAPPVAILAGAFTELSFEPSAGLTLSPGLRVDLSDLDLGVGPPTRHVVVEPRASARFAATKSFALKLAAGLFHQAPTTLIPLPAIDLAALALGLQRAGQVSLGGEWHVIPGLEISADAYINPLLRSLEFDPYDAPPSQGSASAGSAVPEDPATTGLTYGVELLLRRPPGGSWFGWVSYSLSRSTRLTRFTRFDESGTSLGESAALLPSLYDQTHILNAVLGVRLGAYDLGAALHFHTGRPEGGLLSGDPLQQGVDADGKPVWVKAGRDRASRLPSFTRVDVRLFRSWDLGELKLDAFLEILNALLRPETTAFHHQIDSSLATPYVRTPIQVPLAFPSLGLAGRF